jgi:predicted MFS family arabinose efflux permease
MEFPMSRLNDFSDVKRAFQIRDFTIFMVGRFIAHITTWIYRMALGWLIWEMTHSATWLGIIGFVDHVPSIIVAPIAGAWSDRADRLKVLRFTQVNQVIQAVALSALILFNQQTIELLVLLAFYHGLIQGAQSPAMHSVVPNLVPRDLLTTAFGLNSISFNISRFIGPPIGAMIMVHLGGPGSAILCHAFGAGLFTLSLLMIRVNMKASNDESRDRNLLRDIRDSVRYATRHKGIGPLMLIMLMLGALTFSIVEMLPGFAGGVFNEGADGYSWMLSAMGVGAIIQGALLAQRGTIIGLTRYFNIHIAIVSLAYLALTATETFWVGLGAILVVGYAQSATRVGPLTLLQNAVEAEMRGRISSFWTVIYQSSPAVGAMIIGVLSDHFGIRETFTGIAILNFFVFLWVLKKRPQMEAALEYNSPTETTEAAKPAP